MTLKWKDVEGQLATLGPGFRKFLQSDEGQAFLAMLHEKQRDLAVEALDAPAEGATQDFYKGQRAAIAWLAAQLGILALREAPGRVVATANLPHLSGYSDGGTA